MSARGRRSDWLEPPEDALGLESGVVVVVAYDERWPVLFGEAETEIRRVVGERILAVEHVGSTAVTGLSAKPIIDILVGVSDFQDSLELVPALASIGYEYRPGEEILDRHYFRRRVGGRRTHHLSLAEPASSHYRKTIAFRDALRIDPALASAYEALKLELAARFPRNREAYIAGKTDFVLAVLAGRSLFHAGD